MFVYTPGLLRGNRKQKTKTVSISHSFYNYLMFSKNAGTSLWGGDIPWPTKIENALFQFSVSLSGSLRYTTASSKTLFISFFFEGGCLAAYSYLHIYWSNHIHMGFMKETCLQMHVNADGGIGFQVAFRGKKCCRCWRGTVFSHDSSILPNKSL